MRVIAGDRKGLHLKSLKGNDTRPTTDKVKESLFNRIGPYFDGGVVVELFGGSGALSLEALSRGAERAFIFEKSSKACAVIRANAELCRYTDVIHIERTDARHAVKVMKKQKLTIDLLFIDPPYAENKYYELAEVLAVEGILSERAIIICEHDKRTELPLAYGQYEQVNRTVYGNSAISIYKK